MKYQINNYSYNNTGGGCMVGTFEVWLPDENRTVWLHINEEGGTLATCNYICSEIEFEPEMEIYSQQFEFLEERDRYYELFIEAYHEYIKSDCKRYKSTYSLSIELLTKELRGRLTPAYITWHLDNVGDYFETDGYEVYPDDNYHAEPFKMKVDREVVDALINFKSAAYRLDEVYQDMLFDYLSEKYPFDYCFHELTADIHEWCDDIINSIIVK